MVPTSQCWRQCSWVLDISGRYGGKRAVLRGERAISRKAIAQGMSDVLRCPVCSCAHFLVHDAHEIAGAARIRHSLRPLIWRAKKFQQTSGATRRENADLCLPVIPAQRLCRCRWRCERSEPRRMNRPRSGPSSFEGHAARGHLRMTDYAVRVPLLCMDMAPPAAWQIDRPALGAVWGSC